MLFSANQDRDLQARVQLITRVNNNSSLVFFMQVYYKNHVLHNFWILYRFVHYKHLTMFSQHHIFKLIHPMELLFWETIGYFIWIMFFLLIVLNRQYLKDMLSQLSMLVLKVHLLNYFIENIVVQLLTILTSSCMALEGFNITVIAYGQTGSGKTFTIFGPGLLYTMNESDFGMVPRTVRNLFYKAKVNNLQVINV